MQSLSLQRLLLFLCVSTSVMKAHAFDRSFFYRASSFWDEPRFAYPWLSTATLQVTGGSTSQARNSQSRKVPLFNLYGPENFKNITINSPDVDNFPCTNTFDIFTFQGSFDITELNINLYQNFCRGFFAHMHIPVVSANLFVKDILQCDKPDGSSIFCNLYQNKREVLKRFLASRNISLKAIHERGFSDISLLAGWTINYQDLEYGDFCDFTAQLGVLFPSGKEKSIDQVFSIPLGYNGHWGIPWCLDASYGYFEWLTLGAHADGVRFFDRNQCVRMNTQENCTGLIGLEKGLARVRAGSVWRLGGYGKADHFGWGFSLAMAITYEHQNDDCIYPCDTIKFKPHIANNEQELKRWSRWIYQFILEYDFAEHCSYVHPHIAFLYNHQMTGKRVFSTDMLGGYTGLNITCDF